MHMTINLITNIYTNYDYKQCIKFIGSNQDNRTNGSSVKSNNEH